MKKYKKIFMRLIPVVILLVLTIGLSEIFYQNLIESEKAKSWKELSVAHGEVSREVDNSLTSNLNMLTLAADAIMMNADINNVNSVRSYLSRVRTATIFNRIDVLYPDGKILVSSTGEEIAYSDTDKYQHLADKESHISQRTSDFLDADREVVHFFAPVPVYNTEGKSVAILCATAYCSTLAEIFSSVYYGDNAPFFVVDMRDGKIIIDKRSGKPGSIYDMAGYDAPKEYKGKDFIADIMQGNSGTMAYNSKAYKQTSYTYYAPINETFTLVMVVQEKVVFSAVNSLRNTLMWVGIIEVGLLIIFAIWVYNIMIRTADSEKRATEAELALLHQKDVELQSQFNVATERREFLEAMALNLPGGYHRCTTDYKFKLTFISNSFTQVTGYNMEQIEKELDGGYMGIVAPEDREYFLSLAPQLEKNGFIHCSYRMRRRDGSIRWVKDTTQYVERDGEKYYQCALMDITEQIEEIESAKQAAEASSQAKSTFLFNISHDIRTPMNAIKGFSQMILENADNSQMVIETIEKIEQASNSLMMLMNDVLDIARIERGKEELNLRPVDLYEHGRNLYEMFAGDMKAAGINFVVGGDEIYDYVYCDDLKLTRIMMNMLSNAKKFTPKGGTVTCGATKIGCDEQGCTYRFFVRDTGIGMSQEFLKRAYGQFERERTSTESGVAGSGLGLAIIKMLVDLMGGTVEIQSELGKGTEISATLKFKLADKAQIEKETAREQHSLDMSGKRVLLVEDNAFNREIAKYVLENMRFTVEEAENGAVCIEKLIAAQSDYYDLILMDIQMPVMDGYTATTEIRNFEDKKIASIPIVAMTANAFEEDKKKCLEVGMNGHIGKPIEMDALIKALLEVF